MTTVEDLLRDFALDIIHNVVELKDPKTDATEYDEAALIGFIEDYTESIKEKTA